MRHMSILARVLGSSLLLAYAGPSLGQTISSVSGQLAQENAVAITGLNFGTRDINNNLIYDGMESGSFNPRWTSPRALTVDSESRHARSQYAAHIDFKNYAENGFFTGGANDPGPWFCQYWFKLGDNWTWGTTGSDQLGANLSNIKMFRMWESGSSVENFYIASFGWEDVMFISNSGVDAQEKFYAANGYQTKWAPGSWHLFQFEFKDSSLGVADGAFRWWIDGELEFEDTHMMTREDEAPYKRPYILGFFNSWGDNSTDSNDFWLDDAYIDDSWARVELGNASSYESCTHREIQPLVDWSATQVRVTLNQGSFNAGEAAYLFVVGPTGQRSPGFPVTIGGTVENNAPGQPGKPQF